jgi:hypothetical protein
MSELKNLTYKVEQQAFEYENSSKRDKLTAYEELSKAVEELKDFLDKNVKLSVFKLTKFLDLDLRIVYRSYEDYEPWLCYFHHPNNHTVEITPKGDSYTCSASSSGETSKIALQKFVNAIKGASIRVKGGLVATIPDTLIVGDF